MLFTGEGVIGGLYRFSRNPAYDPLFLVYADILPAENSAWPLRL